MSMPSMADEQQLLELLESVQSSPQNLDKAIHAGDERALLCKYCHGIDGNSKKDTIPNLAAQNPEYLIRQFELFARGERTNKTMNELAKMLGSEDKVNIALFFSTQEVKSQKTYKPELVETGKKLFNTRCFFCHGKDAHGKDSLPRISSQPPAYIIRTLKSYNAGQAKRAETAMSRIGRSLEIDEIEALTAYLTTLK
jgi:cytochrome c553